MNRPIRTLMAILAVALLALAAWHIRQMLTLARTVDSTPPEKKKEGRKKENRHDITALDEREPGRGRGT